MHLPVLLVLLVIGFSQSTAQEKFINHPKTLHTQLDSFSIRWGKKGISRYKFSEGDSANYNTGALPGEYLVIYSDTDSIKVRYSNTIPYGQYYYVRFNTRTNRKVIRLGFDMQYAIFSKAYAAANTGQAGFAIPEVYELANIIWTLSPGGERTGDFNKENDYYKQVITYFKPYRNHPIFQQLDCPDSLYYSNYYDFRENSFAFSFKGDKATKLNYAGPYYYVYGNEFADNSRFGKLKALVEDFAQQSNFRKFYRDHLPYYQQQVARQARLLPIKQMWNWLEKEFPAIKNHSYQVIFSPLIGGSHSTQQYNTDIDTTAFNQTLMFICGPDRVDNDAGLSEKQKEGLMSGIVFTEIDHNYVNRISNRYRKRIDSIFSARQLWTKTGKGSDFYARPINVFNEYMTWSVFCLYVLEHYQGDDAAFIVQERENRMVENRNFHRFRAFNQALIDIRKTHPGLTVMQLYPFILDWCSKQQ